MKAETIPFSALQAPFQFFPAFTALMDALLKATTTPPDRLTGWSLDDRDPRIIRQVMPWLDWLYQHYFRVQTSGWEHIPAEGKVMLIGSHNGGLAAPDMSMMMYDWYRQFGPERPAYGLMHPVIWTVLPGLAKLGAQVGALRAHPKMGFAALKRQASLLIYPGGAQDVFRPYSDSNKIYFHGRQGFIKLALRTETPIIPAISFGAHATLIVLADIYPQVKQLHQLGMPWPLDTDPIVCPIYLGLPWGLAIGPLPNLPLPVQIHTRICPPIVFERYGEKASRDGDYVDECYEKVVTLMQSALDQLIQDVIA